MSKPRNNKKHKRVELPPNTPEDLKDKIRTLSEEYNTPERQKEQKKGKITKELCEKITSLYENGVQPSTIKDVLPISSRDTIYYHVNDNCSHDTKSRVAYDECGWMRFYAKQGASTGALSVLYNCSKKSVINHVSGRCSHDHGCQTVDANQMFKQSRAQLGREEIKCEGCGEMFEKKKSEERSYCSRDCYILDVTKS